MSDRIGRDEAAPTSGPFDDKDAPNDGVRRIDLGSVRLPIPDGSEVLVDVSPENSRVFGVHWRTPLGQFTVSAYAAPSSGGMWEQVRLELAEVLRNDGGIVHHEFGDWGGEVVALLDDLVLRFVAVDGPRWMLRGAVAGPPAVSGNSASALRDILRDTVVVRDDSELPDRTPLPFLLPTELTAGIPPSEMDEVRRMSIGRTPF